MDKRLVAQLHEQLATNDLRKLGEVLLKVADGAHRRVQREESRSVFSWPSKLREIEKDQYNLAWQATKILERRGKRRAFFPKSYFGEAAWDMLLDLFIQDSGRRRVSISSLCTASNGPDTTALRWIGTLEEDGFVVRCGSEVDKRVVYIELTDKGRLAVGQYLQNI